MLCLLNCHQLTVYNDSKNKCTLEHVFPNEEDTQLKQSDLRAVYFAGDGFSVAFDPLDGSSVVDTNFSVGTIFGVWPGDKLVGITGRDQVTNPSCPA